jgi:Ca2+-binding EF-hand superfamily protein
MPALLLILTALAVQPAAPSQPAVRGRAFISPMGEPFHSGGDGLVAWFQQADRNHDGSVTLDELKADAQRFYQTLDSNKDGEIDPDEVERYENVIAPEVRSGSGFGGAAQDVDDEATGAGRFGLLTIPEPVTAADSNLDRGVSTQEFLNAAEKRFGLLDRDGDGRLTLAELQAQRSAVRSNARRKRPQQSDPDQDNGLPPIGGDSMPQGH